MSGPIEVDGKIAFDFTRQKSKMNLVGFQGYIKLHQQNVADPSHNISPVMMTGSAGNSSALHGADKRLGFHSIHHRERLV